MIIINKIENRFEREGEIVIAYSPERELTESELLTVTSMVCNDEHYIYYQGDEPLNK